MQAIVDAFTAETGIAVTVNTVDHGTFQDQISSYLQGTPDDVFTWFAGYPHAVLRRPGPRRPTSPTSGRRSAATTREAFKAASTGNDGKQYFIPFYNYPWVVIYRKSLFEEKGYTVPTTWDEFTALGDKMKTDGLVPLAFADKDGWPAMGTFDILNMRLNGYDFHIGLMAGTRSGPTRKTKAVFEKWRELLPYLQEGALGRTWQDGAQSMVNKEAGMYFLGTFAGRAGRRPADRGRPRLLPVPDARHGVRRRARHRRTDRRLHAERQRRPEPGRAPRRSSSTSPPAPAQIDVPRVQPEQRGRGQRRGHERLQRTSRRSRPRSSPAPARSPSSSTATRARTSPARTACRASCRAS